MFGRGALNISQNISSNRYVAPCRTMAGRGPGVEEERKRKHEGKPQVTKQLLVSQRIRIKHHVCASDYVRDARRSEDRELGLHIDIEH